MKIRSPAFEEGKPIPIQYTCEGANGNPPLAFSDIPPAAQSLALIVDDPDAPGGMFVHWLVWNISPDIPGIDENFIIPGAVEGLNGAGADGYTGPCPPSGTHRYFFRLYALDIMLALPPSATADELQEAMEEHIVDQAELMGTYEKQGG